MALEKIEIVDRIEVLENGSVQVRTKTAIKEDGVEISSIQTIHEKVVNDRAYVTSDKQVLQEVNNQTVKAHVRAMWHDKSKDEIWVWVYPVSE